MKVIKMNREQAVKLAEERNQKGFEGDEFIHEEIKKLVSEYGINNIIETGTYKGHTTKRFADLAKTLTLEINQEYFKEAQITLANNPNVIMYLGNSVQGLKEYLPKVKGSNLLFFLDAHWFDYCPLLDELKVIAENEIKPVIVIHDFKVPNHPELGFDAYKGQDFDFDFIKDSLKEIYGEEGCLVKYNSETSEGSAKRGVIYIMPIISASWKNIREHKIKTIPIGTKIRDIEDSDCYFEGIYEGNDTYKVTNVHWNGEDDLNDSFIGQSIKFKWWQTEIFI